MNENINDIIKNADTVYSRRKTLAIEVKKDGSLVIRAPLFTPKKTVDKFVQSKKDWIIKAVERVKVQQTQRQNVLPLTNEQKAALKKQAMEYIPKSVMVYANAAGIKYGKISYRFQKTRWGSCNRKGDLSFNCLLMLAPQPVCDSVIVHELCHIKHFDHSQKFYKEVERLMPDYKNVNRWLKDNGDRLLAKLK
ncbi:MAG: M48 family metallopeptidase [Oscillospiraceae bacterium]|nr:M48 family metallopeptidase [Candidatus Equicaccousia limihippi]